MYRIFIFAIVTNLIQDTAPPKYAQFIPIPMSMAIPFYIGAYFSIDMFVGTVILFVWEKLNRKESEVYAGWLASGLICGDGIWTIPAAILSLSKLKHYHDEEKGMVYVQFTWGSPPLDMFKEESYTAALAPDGLSATLEHHEADGMRRLLFMFSTK